MNELQRKICKKYMHLAERNKNSAEELKPRMDDMTAHGGWDIGYREGYYAGVANLIDELLASEGMNT